MKGSKLIVWGAIAALAAGGMLWSKLSATLPVSTAELRRGTIHSHVDEKARTSLANPYQVRMPLTGRILPIEVEEGDLVEAGQIVARMDPGDLDDQLRQIEAEREALDAQIAADKKTAIEKLALQEYERFIEAFDAVIETSVETQRATAAQLEYAKFWMQSQEEAFQTNATSEAKLREARMQAAGADVSLNVSRLFTDALRATKAAMMFFPAYVDAYLDLKAAKRIATEKQRDAANVKVELVTRDRGRAEIKSPAAGVVLRRHFSNEAVLAAGTPLLEIGALSDLEVTAELLTKDALSVKPGQRVELRGVTGESIRGEVRLIKPEAFTKLSSLGVEQQRVEVVITPDRQQLAQLRDKGLPLGLGFRVYVRIFTEQRDDVVVAPRRALIRAEAGAWRIYVMRDGRVALLEVEVGIGNDDEVEILSGLDADQTVILSPSAELFDGAKVSVE